MPTFTRIRRALTAPVRPSTASSSSDVLSTTSTTITITSHSDARSTTSSSSPTTSLSPSPTASITDLPNLVLTRTSTGLSKIRSTVTGWNNPEEKHRRRIEEWRRRDELEWQSPGKEAQERRSRKWSRECQDMLREYEIDCRERSSMEGARSPSFLEGISPCTSRVAL